MKHAIWSAAILCVFSVPAMAVEEPELAPPPRLVEQHVRFQQVVGGYQIVLTRKASEKLRDALADFGDGQQFTDVAKIAVKELNDPEAEKKLDFLAFIVKSQAPALMKSLTDKMTADGAVIKVLGVENKNIRHAPLIKAIGQAFVPPEAREKMETTIKVINTTPLYWTVEGRK